MTSQRKFYRTVFQIEVLTEDEPFVNEDLDEIAYAITEGHASGVVTMVSNDAVPAPEMVALLKAQASDPEFFLLDDNGNDLEEQA